VIFSETYIMLQLNLFESLWELLINQTLLAYHLALILAQLSAALALLTFILLSTLVFLLRVLSRLRKQLRGSREVLVGFFHPYCNAGGGGERVLWCAVNAVQNKYPDAKCVVYTGDCDATGDEILNKAHNTFGIKVKRKVHFVYLRSRFFVEAKNYPVLTLLGQSLGSVALGLEALLRCPPDIYVDTMGYAFTLPLFKHLCSCATGCYVHYPTISTDMLAVVECRNDSFNNRKIIAGSRLLTQAKLQYYRLFARMYGVAGRQSSVTMVNSSWTQGHIDQLWKVDSTKIFPPCDVGKLMEIPLERSGSEEKLVVSVAQFRPEKNHKLQVLSFHKFLSQLDVSDRKYRLTLAGGCRNEGDENRVNELKELIKSLDMESKVDIETNISYERLLQLYSSAHVGMHTMNNEHFGIGVVEFQAAGVVVLAHNSGGPKMDIVQAMDDGELSGRLADGVDAYSESLRDIFHRESPDAVRRMRVAARKSCERFSEEGFVASFQRAVEPLFQ